MKHTEEDTYKEETLRGSEAAKEDVKSSEDGFWPWRCGRVVVIRPVGCLRSSSFSFTRTDCWVKSAGWLLYG